MGAMNCSKLTIMSLHVCACKVVTADACVAPMPANIVNALLSKSGSDHDIMIGSYFSYVLTLLIFWTTTVTMTYIL